MTDDTGEKIDHLPPPEDDLVEENPPDVLEEPKKPRRTYSRRYQREIDELRNELTQLKSSQYTQQAQKVQQDVAAIDNEYQQAAQYLDQARKLPADHPEGSRHFLLAQDRFNRAQYNRERAYEYMQNLQRQPAPETEKRLSKAVQRWQEDNDWFSDPDYKRETRKARSIDTELAEEWEPEDDGPIGGRNYMQEFDRRCRSDPELKPLYKGVPPRVERGRTVAGTSGPSQTSNRPQLTKALEEAARIMGKPIDDPKYRERLGNFLRRTNVQN